MALRHKYSCLPSKRNGRCLTAEDRLAATRNFLDACADVMGFTYSSFTEYEDSGEGTAGGSVCDYSKITGGKGDE